MSAKRTDISQINKYLKGKLDARAMNKLERAAQQDPFLMDALEGFEAAGIDHDANLADLKNRLAERVAPKKERRILSWRFLPIAASLLIMLGAGYWFFKPDALKPQYANVIEPKKVDKKPDTATQLVGEQAKLSSPSVAQKVTPRAQKAAPSPNIQNAIVEETIKPIDTTELIAQNKPIVKINGKEFQGGNVQQAVKNLPADVLEKVQVIDDYGDQAKKSGIRPNSYILSGKITDRATGEPLPGTTVGIPGKGLTQTDVNGNYSVVVDSNAVYAFSQVGYVTQTVKLKPGQKTLNIHLNTDNRSLTETVVRGYVKRDKAETTGSSYIVTGKEVQNVPVGNVEQLLQGKVPGLNIQNNKKGQLSNYGKANTLDLAKTPTPSPDSIKTDKRLAEVVIRGYVKRTREETTGSSYIITGKEAKKTDKGSNWVSGGKIPGKFLPINPAKPTVANNSVSIVEQKLQGVGIGLIIQNSTGIYNKNAAYYTVTGKVTHGKDGTPFEGVTIAIKDKVLITTDENGVFNVLIPRKATVTFSYAGYISKSAKIGRPCDLQVILVEDNATGTKK